MDHFEEQQRQRELERLRELERKDLEVEANRGPRPLEGFSGGLTNWTEEQDDASASEVHAQDAEASVRASERQAEGDYPVDPGVIGDEEPPPAFQEDDD